MTISYTKLLLLSTLCLLLMCTISAHQGYEQFSAQLDMKLDHIRTTETEIGSIPPQDLSTSIDYDIDPSDDYIDPLLEVPVPWNKERKERLRHLEIYSIADDGSEDLIDLDQPIPPPSPHIEPNPIQNTPSVQHSPNKSDYSYSRSPTPSNLSQAMNQATPSVQPHGQYSQYPHQHQHHQHQHQQIPFARAERLFKQQNLHKPFVLELQQLTQQYNNQVDELTRQYHEDIDMLRHQYESDVTRVNSGHLTPIDRSTLHWPSWNRIQQQVRRNIMGQYHHYRLTPQQTAVLEQKIDHTTHAEYLKQQLYQSYQLSLQRRKQQFEHDRTSAHHTYQKEQDRVKAKLHDAILTFASAHQQNQHHHHHHQQQQQHHQQQRPQHQNQYRKPSSSYQRPHGFKNGFPHSFFSQPSRGTNRFSPFSMPSGFW